MTRKLLFENVTCSRCGGSGNYSYCQMYGTTCFKCHGDGVTLTKKGAAAQAWLNAQKRKPGREVAVDEWVLMDGVPGFIASKWFKVDAVTGTGTEFVMTGLDKLGERQTMNGFWDIEVRVFTGKARDAELRTAALAFQETLTKTGTIRKRKAKTVAVEIAMATS